VTGRAFCGLPWCGMNPLSFAASMSPMIGLSAGHRRSPCQSSHTELTVAPASLNFPSGSATLIGGAGARWRWEQLAGGRRQGARRRCWIRSRAGRSSRRAGRSRVPQEQGRMGMGMQAALAFPAGPRSAGRNSGRPELDPESSQGLVRSRLVAKWSAPCQSQLHSSASSLGSTRKTVFPKVRSFPSRMGRTDGQSRQNDAHYAQPAARGLAHVVRWATSHHSLTQPPPGAAKRSPGH
jgi:hypothetical protein